MPLGSYANAIHPDEHGIGIFGRHAGPMGLLPGGRCLGGLPILIYTHAQRHANTRDLG